MFGLITDAYSKIHYGVIAFLMLSLLTDIFRRRDFRTGILPMAFVSVLYGLLHAFINSRFSGGMPFSLYIATLVILAAAWCVPLPGTAFLKAVMILFYLNLIIESSVLSAQALSAFGLSGYSHMIQTSFLISSLILVLCNLLVHFHRVSSQAKLSPSLFLWLFLSFLSVFITLNLWRFSVDTVSGKVSFLQGPMVESVLTLFLDLSLYLFFSRIAAESEEKLHLTLENQRSEMQVKEISLAEKRSEEYRKERHEWKNRLLQMQLLLDEGRVTDSIRLIEKESASLEHTSPVCRCGSHLIDMVLDVKADEATRRHLPILVDAYVPGKVSVPDDELCSLLCNLLDNAMEASEKESDPDIRVKVKQIRQFLAIEIRNRCSTDVLSANPEMKTTKGEEEFHGIGIGVVKEITRKYGGSLTMKMEGGFFVAAALLKSVPD